MVFILGIPVFFFELLIGQYSGLGPQQVFSCIAPLFSGVGICTLVVITLVIVYYMVIIAWIIFYLFASFSYVLGWSSCHNDFNTIGKQNINFRLLKLKNNCNKYDASMTTEFQGSAETLKEFVVKM